MMAGSDSRNLSLNRWAQVATVAVGVIAFFAALQVAAVAVLPIVLALLLCLLLWPLRQGLARWMPRWAAALLCGTVLVLALGLLVGTGWYAGTSAMEQFESSKARYADKYREIRSWLIEQGVPRRIVPGLGSEPARADSGQSSILSPSVQQELLAVAAGGLRSAVGVVVASVLTVFLAYLALLEGDRWDRWVRDRIRQESYERLRMVTHKWSRIVRSYFFARSISGLINGASAGLFLWAMGVPMALTWAVLSFFMNFIPNIGALIATIPPILLAFVDMGATQGIIVAAGLWLIETLLANILDPLIQGDMLQLSMFVVLASMIVWGWLWGAAGAVLAPVLTAGLCAVVSHFREDSS